MVILFDNLQLFAYFCALLFGQLYGVDYKEDLAASVGLLHVIQFMQIIVDEHDRNKCLSCACVEIDYRVLV